MAKIHLPQLKKSLTLDCEKNLMSQLLDQRVPVASSCHGDGICAKCRVQVQSHTPLPPPKTLERKTLQKNQALPNERLSCQLVVKADIELRTTYW